MRARHAIAGLALGVLAASSLVAADKAALKAVSKEVTEVFSDTSFVAKMDLRRYAHHFVLPDGSPSPQKSKKQGRGGEGSIRFDSGIKVRAGEIGEAIFIARVKGDEIWVGFNKKRGAYLNAPLVHILYGREVTVDDLTPEKIARACESVVEIRGYEPGADIDAAFDEVLATAPEPERAAPSAPPAPTRATVEALVVRAQPATVRPGGEVELVLDYRVAGVGAPVNAIESRSLAVGGRTVPTYPVTDEIVRESGAYTSNYRQPLPHSAQPGVYTFKGEVCVAGDCISRTVTFEVVRD